MTVPNTEEILVITRGKTGRLQISARGQGTRLENEIAQEGTEEFFRMLVEAWDDSHQSTGRGWQPSTMKRLITYVRKISGKRFV